MLDTGFPRADVENDFLRARLHQILATRPAHGTAASTVLPTAAASVTTTSVIPSNLHKDAQ
jgi:hypothetical protein